MCACVEIYECMNVRLCAHAMPAVYGCALSSLSVGELEEWVDGWARCHFY